MTAGLKCPHLPLHSFLQEKTIMNAFKILIVLTSHSQLGETGKPTGYYLPEVTHAYFAFREAGFDVDFVSPQGGKAPMDPGSKNLSDPLNKRFLEDSQALAKVEQTLKPEHIAPKDYAAIYYAGGHGTMWDFPNNTAMNAIAASIYEQGGVVSAVCHGPAGLMNIKLKNGLFLVQGKELTAFSNAEEEEAKLTHVMPFLLEEGLKDRGGHYSKAPLWQAHVIISERLVTGQNPASARGVAEQTLRLLSRAKQ